MGAGRQRWWRDYDQEVAVWTGTTNGQPWKLMEERTSSGIVVRLTLYTWPIGLVEYRYTCIAD